MRARVQKRQSGWVGRSPARPLGWWISKWGDMLGTGGDSISAPHVAHREGSAAKPAYGWNRIIGPVTPNHEVRAKRAQKSTFLVVSRTKSVQKVMGGWVYDQRIGVQKWTGGLRTHVRSCTYVSGL